MKRFWLLLFAAFSLNTFFNSTPVDAVAIRLQPLEYKEVLAKGEKKKGFIDVSNPSDDPIKVTTSVQAFRQVNDQGNLEFIDNEQVEAGIIPDLKEFDLAPKDTMRLFFLIDGTKLPSGDVFGALFVTANSTKKTNSPITQPARLGTLFSLINGTPGTRNAEITSLSVPFLQLGGSSKGTYAVRNMNPSSATGFYPQVEVGVSPFGKTEKKLSKLVFPGRTRENQFTVPAGNYFGFYKVSVTFGQSEQSKWAFIVSGWGRFLPIPIILAGLIAWMLLRPRKPDYRVNIKR